jgi:hypothetical protein
MSSQEGRIYAYVDESGQDTRGALFVVAVVVVAETRDALRQQLQEIEHASHKQAKKWAKSRPRQREAYIRLLIRNAALAGRIYYSEFRDSRAYVDLMILATAKAVLARAEVPHRATITIDGLGRTERHRFAAGLRKLRIAVRKIRGARDQSEEFIRLADAIAGFVRDGLEGDQTMQPLFENAKQRRIIREV